MLLLSLTAADPLLALSPPPACRSLQRMSDSLQSIVMEAAMAPKPSTAPGSAPTAPATPTQPQVAAASGPADRSGNGGRRLLAL